MRNGFLLLRLFLNSRFKSRFPPPIKFQFPWMHEILLPILPSLTIALHNCLCLVIWHFRAIFPTNMLSVVTFLFGSGSMLPTQAGWLDLVTLLFGAGTILLFYLKRKSFQREKQKTIQLCLRIHVMQIGFFVMGDCDVGTLFYETDVQ